MGHFHAFMHCLHEVRKIIRAVGRFYLLYCSIPENSEQISLMFDTRGWMGGMCLTLRLGGHVD